MLRYFVGLNSQLLVLTKFVEGEREDLKNMSLTLSGEAILSVHEQLMNVAEPSGPMYTAPPSTIALLSLKNTGWWCSADHH